MVSTADLVREARLAAGLTQRELAARAGTSAAAVNRYERHHTTPSLQTVQRVLDACGFDLHVSMTRRADGAADAATPDQAERDRQAVQSALAPDGSGGWVRSPAPTASR